MQRLCYYPTPGVSFKLYHVLDCFHDSATRWSPITGLAAEDTSTTPDNEKDLVQSIFDYFCNNLDRPNPTPYVPVVLRQHVDIEALKQRVGEEILVLEIDVEKMMPGARIYPVRDIVTGFNLEWPGGARAEWLKTYLILHRVPKEAITVFTPDGLVEKEREVRCQKDKAIYDKTFGALRAHQAAEAQAAEAQAAEAQAAGAQATGAQALSPIQDVGSSERIEGKRQPFFSRLFKGRRR